MGFDLSRFRPLCELVPDGDKLRPRWDPEFWATKSLSRRVSAVYVITVGGAVYKIGMTDGTVSGIVNGYCKSDFLKDRAAHRDALLAAVASGEPVRFSGFLVEQEEVERTMPSGRTVLVRTRCGAELERDALEMYREAHGDVPPGNHFEKAPRGRRAG